MTKVSIIVPVYNVEPYFDQCVQSLLNQTYTDIEIILIDDGSPDGCPAMCDQYAVQDLRVRVVHQANQGVSVARNTGLDMAQGEWIMFCDPDDWYELNAVEIMLAHAEEYKSDVASFGIVAHYPRTINMKFISYCDTLLKINNELTTQWTWVWGTVARLYRKELIDKYCIRFDPSIVISEDLIFSIQSICKGKRVSLSSQCIYHYRINEKNDSCGRRYRPDTFSYYEKIERDMKSLLFSAFSVDTAEYIYQFEGIKLIYNGLVLTCMNPNAPIKLKQRLDKVRIVLENEPWASIVKINKYRFPLKNRIPLFLFRHRFVLLYCLFNKAWTKIRRFA